MSTAMQRYDKLKIILPFIHRKTGVEIPDEELKASAYDVAKITSILGKPKPMQKIAIDVMINNLGIVEDQEPDLSIDDDAGLGKDIENDIKFLCKIFRRLDGLATTVRQPGYFKAANVAEDLGNRLFEASMGIVSKYIDPVEFVRMRKDGIL